MKSCLRIIKASNFVVDLYSTETLCSQGSVEICTLIYIRSHSPDKLKLVACDKHIAHGGLQTNRKQCVAAQ